MTSKDFDSDYLEVIVPIFWSLLAFLDEHVRKEHGTEYKRHDSSEMFVQTIKLVLSN